MSSVSDLWKGVFEHCIKGDTGSYFLASDENKSGQVVVENGRLVTVVYAGAFAQEAVEKLKALKSLKFSFSPDLVFPSALKLSEHEAEVLLDSLGFEEAFDSHISNNQQVVAEQDSEVASQASEPEYVEITYRGQKIKRLKETATNTKSSSQRIYRGQVVKD